MPKDNSLQIHSKIYISKMDSGIKLEISVTRILSLVIPDYPVTGMLYGAERSFADLANNLANTGADVFVLEQYGLYNTYSKSYNFHRFDAKGARFFLLRNTVSAIRIIRKFKCDGVFAYHSDHINSVIPAYLASLITGKQLLIGVLDDRMAIEDRLRSFELLSLYKSRERKFKNVAKRFLSSIMRRVACRGAICLTPTNHIATSYATKYLHPKAVFVIGRGVNDVWFRAESSRIEQMYDASYSGRIDPDKGIFTLFEAWKRVTEKKPEAKLLIIGEAWPGMFQIYSSRIQELHLENNVIFAGYLSDEASIRGMLRSSKIFVLPSKLEGLSRSVLEAMASGLPCIVGDIPTVREVYGEAAVFVPTEDSIALARSILDLLSDEEGREILSRRSMLLAKRFSWERVAQRTTDIIDSVIKKKSRREEIAPER